jgi:hypothetical protein
MLRILIILPIASLLFGSAVVQLLGISGVLPEPLGRCGQGAASGGHVVVAGRTNGKLYDIDLRTQEVKMRDIGKSPLEVVVREGRVMLVHSSGVLESQMVDFQNGNWVSVNIRRNLLGEPIAVHPDGNERKLQPLLITLAQFPVPFMYWVGLLVLYGIMFDRKRLSIALGPRKQ